MALVREARRTREPRPPQVVIDVPLSDDPSALVISISGTVGNEDAAFLEAYLARVTERMAAFSVVVIDVRELPFCYSGGVKALMGFALGRPAGTDLVFRAGRAMWQATSLRALCNMTRSTYESAA